MGQNKSKKLKEQKKDGDKLEGEKRQKKRKRHIRRFQKVKESSVVSEHVAAINFILTLESVWNYFKTCIIAECENRWIVDGRIYKKEVKA